MTKVSGKHILEEVFAQESTLMASGYRLYHHAKGQCGGERCVIHNPSGHSMILLPLRWRDDRGIFERVCPCGIGHPDPDQFDFWERAGLEGMAVHGCCGHCRPGMYEELNG